MPVVQCPYCKCSTFDAEGAFHCPNCGGLIKGTQAKRPEAERTIALETWQGQAQAEDLASHVSDKPLPEYMPESLKHAHDLPLPELATPRPLRPTATVEPSQPAAHPQASAQTTAAPGQVRPAPGQAQSRGTPGQTAPTGRAPTAAAPRSGGKTPTPPPIPLRPAPRTPQPTRPMYSKPAPPSPWPDRPKTSHAGCLVVLVIALVIFLAFVMTRKSHNPTPRPPLPDPTDLRR